MSKPNGILSMDPEKYREIDGVVFDLDSYERHCGTQTAASAATEAPKDASAPAAPSSPKAAPAPVFPVDPFPAGWYPAEEGQSPIPVMGGALPPCAASESTECPAEVSGVRIIRATAGSGSSYSSFMTSYTVSYRSSGPGSGSFAAGGYGLELI